MDNKHTSLFQLLREFYCSIWHGFM